MNYLYYKLYRIALKTAWKDIPEVMSSGIFFVLLFMNFLSINALLSKFSIIPYILLKKDKIDIYIISVILIGFVLLYFNKRRRVAIIEKYSKESEFQRKRGNVILLLFIALTFVLVFTVAFFRPRYFGTFS